MKKIVYSSLAAAVLLLSGCGDSDGEKQVQTQQDLDQGNYEAVIRDLEESAATPQEYMALAAAYMQKAGLGLADLIRVIADASTEENGDVDAFASFVKNVTENSSDSALQDLQKSAEYFESVVPDCLAYDLSSSQQDACLYLGLAQTMKAASTIGYLSSDIEKFGSDLEDDAKLQSAACAMEYALAKNNPDYDIDCEHTIEDRGILTFASGISYEALSVYVDGEEFEHLLSRGALQQTVVTDGYCTTDDFSSRVDTMSAQSYNPYTYHVCPVNEATEAEEITTETLIVSAFNSGVEAVTAVATEDMQGDIDEFKCDLLGGTYYGGGSCSVNLSQDITVAQVIEFINKNN